MDERIRIDIQRPFQMMLRNSNANIDIKGPNGKRTLLRTNTTVVVGTKKGGRDLVDEGPTHGRYGRLAVRRFYSLSAEKKLHPTVSQKTIC